MIMFANTIDFINSDEDSYVFSSKQTGIIHKLFLNFIDDTRSDNPLYLNIIEQEGEMTLQEILISTFNSFNYIVSKFKIQQKEYKIVLYQLFFVFLESYCYDYQPYKEFEMEPKLNLENCKYIFNPLIYKNTVKNKKEYVYWCLQLQFSPTFTSMNLQSKINVLREITKNGTLVSAIYNELREFIEEDMELQSRFDDIEITNSFKPNNFKYKTTHKGDDFVYKYLLYNSINKTISNYKVSDKIGSGRFGNVYTLNGIDNMVAKICENNIDNRREVIVHKILSNFMKEDKEYNYSICDFKGSYIKGEYIITFIEKLDKSLDEFIYELDEDELKACVFQILGSIFKLSILCFTHYDLHLANIMVKQSTEDNFSYKFRGTEYSFKTRYQFKMIDFGFAHISYDGASYFEEEIECVGKIYNPLYDIVKFSYELSLKKLKSPFIKKFNNEIKNFMKLNCIEIDYGGRLMNTGKKYNISITKLIKKIFN